jgi:hypothetical protein
MHDVLYEYLNQTLMDNNEPEIKQNIYTLFKFLELNGLFSYFKYLHRLTALGITDSTSFERKVGLTNSAHCSQHFC